MTETFSINRAADLLERNRRTLAWALKNVTPEDVDKHGHKRWRLATIIDALSEHARITGFEARLRPRPNGHSVDEVGAELMRIANELHAGLQRLRNEPDISRRRQMAFKTGPWIGKLIDAFDCFINDFPPGSRPFMKWASNRIVSDAIEDLADACRWELAGTGAPGDADRFVPSAPSVGPALPGQTDDERKTRPADS